MRPGGSAREEGFAESFCFLYNVLSMSKTKAAVKKETLETLHALVEAAKTARLAPDQEDAAVQCIKDLLVLGRASIAEAVQAMLALQWNVGVAAVTGLWPDMKPLGRKALLTTLAAQKSDSGKRLRLSIARGIFPQDAGIAAQMAAGVCEEMRAEGQLTGRDRMIFSNVFIGKGKPWLLHFSLAEWQPEQADALLACAVDTCFGAPCAPFTQIGLLKWIAEAGRLATLPEETLGAIAKVVKRWTPRFRKELRAAVAELPEPLAEAAAAPAAEAVESAGAEPGDAAPAAEASEEERQEAPAEAGAPSEEAGNEEDSREADSEEKRPGETRAQYPPYVSRTQPAPGAQQQPQQAAQPQARPSRRGGGAAEGAFDLTQALRQIEGHVAGLRRELREAQTALRHQQREDRPSQRGRGDRRGFQENAGTLSPEEIEELRRHNAQLEETTAELRRQLEDLANDHEDHATAMGAHGGEAAPESEAAQLKALLGIKLRELFAEFQTLRAEPADDVLRQHYGDMLAEVFEVLAKQGVPLAGP